MIRLAALLLALFPLLQGLLQAAPLDPVSALWSGNELELHGGGGQVRLAGSTLLGDGPWPALTGPGALRSYELTAAGTAVQQYERALVHQHLRLRGEDAELTITLTNTSPQMLRAFRIGAWRAEVAGQLRWEQRPRPADDYLARQGPAELWPSWWYRLSASWWITDRAGLAVSTRGVGLVRRLWRWREQEGSWRLTLFLCDDVPPGARRTWTLCFRLSAMPDWRHLLTPYRDDLVRQFGPQRYRGDHRPVIQGLRPAPERVTPRNPHGWVTDGDAPHWSTDLTTVQGMRHWHDRLVRGCALHDAQGVIAWGWACLPGKDEPWYPYDSLDLPPAVARNVAEIKSGLNSVGRRCGHLIRPGYLYERDEQGRLLRAQLLRFSAEAVRKLQPHFDRTDGLAYLDDFGIGFGTGMERTAIDDLGLLQAVRGAVGLGPQWFVEFPSDVALAWAGGYERLVKNDAGVLQFYWLNNHQFEVLRWLYPDSAWIIAQRQELEGMPGLEELLMECKKRRLCPLIQDWLLP